MEFSSNQFNTIMPYFYMPYHYFNYSQHIPQTNPEKYQKQEQKLLDLNVSHKLIISRKDLESETYGNKKRNWTQEEDKKLMKFYQNSELTFEQIAQQIQGRNAKVCYNRYRILAFRSRQYWKKKENDKLLRLVDQMGKNWNVIQGHFPKRNTKQLQYHYENVLRPDLSKNDWTMEQDLQLIDLINNHGRNWKLIQQRMPYRAISTIKNRYFSKLVVLNKKKIQRNVELRNQ